VLGGDVGVELFEESGVAEELGIGLGSDDWPAASYAVNVFPALVVDLL
jgi:hypothetical protein